MKQSKNEPPMNNATPFAGLSAMNACCSMIVVLLLLNGSPSFGQFPSMDGADGDRIRASQFGIGDFSATSLTKNGATLELGYSMLVAYDGANRPWISLTVNEGC